MDRNGVQYAADSFRILITGSVARVDENIKELTVLLEMVLMAGNEI